MSDNVMSDLYCHVDPEDFKRCSRHGNDHMAVMTKQRAGVMTVNGVPQSEGEPMYVCVGCMMDNIHREKTRADQLEADAKTCTGTGGRSLILALRDERERRADVVRGVIEDLERVALALRKSIGEA